MAKRTINVKVNLGEPTDGSGKVCIHLFVQDVQGSFTEPHVLHRSIGEGGQLVTTARPTRGRLACDRRRTVAPATRGGVVTVTPRTDDPRAATCPKCLASVDCAEMLAKLAQAGVAN